eukprot:3446077-Amphidinium_carterae.1
MALTSVQTELCRASSKISCPHRLASPLECSNSFFPKNAFMGRERLLRHLLANLDAPFVQHPCASASSIAAGKVTETCIPSEVFTQVVP